MLIGTHRKSFNALPSAWGSAVICGLIAPSRLISSFPRLLEEQHHAMPSGGKFPASPRRLPDVAREGVRVTSQSVYPFRAVNTTTWQRRHDSPATQS